LFSVYINSNDRDLANNSFSYRVMSLLAVVYLLLFPLSSTVLPHISGVIVTFIVFSSVFLYFFSNNEHQRFNRDERLFCFSVGAMLVVAILATIVSGVNAVGMGKLGKFIYLLMVIPVFYYFRVIRVRSDWIWYGLVIGSIASALVGIYEVVNDVYKPGYLGRAKGATHPIIFGDLALIMGAMALAGWGWFKAQANWQVVLPVAALGSGVLASMLSQSRGGWIAVPFLISIFIWYISAYTSKMKMAIGILLIMGLFFVAYQVPQTGMEYRANTTVDNIRTYMNADNKSVIVGTSVSSRFEMWKASWNIFIEHPVLGVGWGKYQENVIEQAEQGKRVLLEGNLDPGNFNHPHNQFLSALASGGVVGFIAVILLFLIPARFFYKACKSAEYNAEVRRLALAGLVFVVGFAIFNLSESFLERSRTVSFFVFYLAVFMAGIRGQKEVIS